MIREKIQQAVSILQEKKIDVWLTFVRETSATNDPALPLIFGSGCVWPMALFIAATGETIAIAGKIDAANTENVDAFDEVMIYEKSIRKYILQVLNRLKPQTIAVNFSVNDYMADGLTHGMYLILRDYLRDTLYFDRLVSSENIVAALRGRKSETEIQRIKEAIRITEEIWRKTDRFLKPGLSEKEIAAFIKNQLSHYQVEPAWDAEMCPSVFTGPDTAETHFGPTDRETEKGHILNMDFGVKKDMYCSDMQRTWYFLRDGESEAPAAVVKGFHAVRDAIRLAAKAIKPGVEMWTIDKVARDHIVTQGFDEYPHGLGHQVGRLAHDGGGLLGPRWERYGQLPYNRIEVGQVFTLEPRVTVPGFGVATMEEMIVVRENGVEFLSHPQEELWLIG